MEPKKAKVLTIYPDDPAERRGVLKSVGGSASDAFNDMVARSTVDALWLKTADPEEKHLRCKAAMAALRGIGPQDELEGMLAAQLVAVNAAAMEGFRRAMIPDQTSEGRRENLSQANKLSRTYVMLLEALNRHRGKGVQQKVTVEHVHVHAGGSAIVGSVEAGGGAKAAIRGLPHANTPSDASEPSLRRAHQELEAVQITRDAERPLPHARREIAGGSERA